MGKRQHPLFGRWYQMRYNCTNENMPEYKHYGGRGLDYDPRWDDFDTFVYDIETYLGEMPFPNAHLDRKNNDKGYWIRNLKWSTAKENTNNRVNNRKYTYRGQTKNIMQWCESTSLIKSTVYSRLHRGWTLPEALGFKKRKPKK